MGKITTLPTPRKKQVFSYLFLSDVHSLYYDDPALSIALKLFKKAPPRQRKIILGGDILDIPFIFKTGSAFKHNLNLGNWDEYFIPEIEKEAEWFDMFYGKISKLTKDIIFLEGNHEARLRQEYFIDYVPHDIKHNFDLRKVIKADDRGIRVFDYNDWVILKSRKIGELAITHGQFVGANPIKKHVFASHSSCLFGHVHEVAAQSFSSINGTLKGYSNGCLCATEPHYMHGRNNNWSVGFTIINQNSDAWFVHQYIVEKNGSESFLITSDGEKISS